MTSSSEKEAFVWIWLPNETKPVVAGRLEADNGNVLFNYGRSYLNRIGDSRPAIPIYAQELPLIAGVLPLPEGLSILCGNTDDHARNHAAFWNGTELTLTPAYDVCPQGRTGNEASQAMLISGNNNLSQLKSCLASAHNFFLSEAEARGIFQKLTATIEQYWDAVCEEAALSDVDKRLLWRRQFLNPYSTEQ